MCGGGGGGGGLGQREREGEREQKQKQKSLAPSYTCPSNFRFPGSFKDVKTKHFHAVH